MIIVVDDRSLVSGRGGKSARVNGFMGWAGVLLMTKVDRCWVGIVECGFFGVEECVLVEMAKERIIMGVGCGFDNDYAPCAGLLALTINFLLFLNSIDLLLLRLLIALRITAA